MKSLRKKVVFIRPTLLIDEVNLWIYISGYPRKMCGVIVVWNHVLASPAIYKKRGEQVVTRKY